MMPSNVSGGFWLQNHCLITSLMGRESVGVGVDIELECHEPSQDEQGYKYAVNTKQTRWAVRYLARKPGGSGMSGGWIHFAIDHVGSCFDLCMLTTAALHMLLTCPMCSTSHCHQIDIWRSHAVDCQTLQCSSAS